MNTFQTTEMLSCQDWQRAGLTQIYSLTCPKAEEILSPVTAPGWQVAVEWKKYSGILPVRLSWKARSNTKMLASVLKEEVANSFPGHCKYRDPLHLMWEHYAETWQRKEIKKYGVSIMKMFSNVIQCFVFITENLSTEFGVSKPKQMTAT